MPPSSSVSRRSVLTMLAAAALARATSRVGAQALPVPVRVGGVPIDVGAGCYYALDMGFFTKHGLAADVQTLANGPVIAAAVVAGALDVGNGNTTVLAAAHERGLPFVMVAPSGMYRSTEPTAGLMVTKTSPIRRPGDLVGKTIGVSTLQAISSVAVRGWLENNGIASDAVKFVEVPYNAMDAALVAGRVDAAVAEEPATSTMAAADCRILARPFDAIGSAFIEGVYFCTLDYAKANLDTVRRFTDAMAETNAWANAHRAQTFAILNKYAKAPFPPTMTRMWYPERLRVADVQPLIDASAKYGLLKSTFPAQEMFAPGIAG